jgi:signal transduction histidine kinase
LAGLVASARQTAVGWGTRLVGRWGLSAKLLALTVLFVMLAEVVIFVPSIANFRTNWLNDRLMSAHLAALSAEAFPGGDVPEPLREELLRTAQVKMVAVKRDEQRKLVLSEDMEEPIDATYDLRQSARDGRGVLDAVAYRLRLVKDALAVFFLPDTRMIRVIGAPNLPAGQFVEIVLPQTPLKAAMVTYGLNVLGLSIIISALAGGLIYLTLRSFLIEPLMRLTRNMLHFSAKPEDASRIIVASARGDELGTAERELAHMQNELNQILAQKSRLAALGLAVSKINHDMRNMLANAQLLSDNLTSVPDARVQRFAPKLIATLDRAINFCNDTLKFGRAAEAPPRRELMLLRPLVEEVGEGLGLPRAGAVAWTVDIDPALRVDADRDQLYRVLSNLARNAQQAIEAQSPEQPGTVTVAARRVGRRVTIDIADDGPGMPAIARAHLFEAFQGSTRRGGSGLGLAIASELVTVHGGSLALGEEVAGQTGTVFTMVIPDRAISAAA